ncbi:phage infection protein [Rhodococcus sp. 15-725-2-2b]|uniref:phage infection protein n=1 Tax=unclassified Rhodococcus (in: high G+C Gram-positive bacteria) TaxID=192944 RepID=UPI000B9C119C|nr:MULTISPECIES: phage infection protein [unclassified Rhodococcus (in: high G+C Gram-positive bacteria)]OZC69301.1 phage infection protein [Rhodococcus sp. 06-469-3-2]OZD45688.1 phage infection protein [Rhodococcus sp. 06-1477-1A]OZE75695.1 phage infection protein [Rhodococcus sp. 15-725-2-2b]
MGELRIFRRPAVALTALAFPLVAVGAFALGTGYDLGGEPAATTTVVADTEQAPAADQQTADPLAAARSSLNSASLPITFLSSGIGQLTDGGTQLNDGVGQLADGITQAHDGTIQLADGFGQYRDGIGQLGDGASQISGGVDQVVDQLAGFGALQADFTAKLAATADQVDRFPHPGSDAISGEIRGVIDTLNTQAFGPDTLAQLQTLKSGAQQLSSELNDPNSQFLGATAQLGDATVQLRDGLGQLDDGGQQLKAGTDQLVTSVEPVEGIVNGIATNVRDASAALPPGTAAATDDAASDQNIAATSSSTGTGATPYLIAALIALGALGCVSLVRVLGRDSKPRWLAVAAAVAAVGISAAVAFAFATDAALGPVLGAGAFLIVSAAAYLAAAGAIQRVLGAVIGQIVNVAALAVQVVVCGFAYASTAPIWGDLAAFMPMSYTAAGARVIASGEMSGTGWLAIGATMALLIVSTLVYASVRGESADRPEGMNGGRSREVGPELA